MDRKRPAGRMLFRPGVEAFYEKHKLFTFSATKIFFIFVRTLGDKRYTSPSCYDVRKSFYHAEVTRPFFFHYLVSVYSQL